VFTRNDKQHCIYDRDGISGFISRLDSRRLIGILPAERVHSLRSSRRRKKLKCRPFLGLLLLTVPIADIP
jgi:hypothetical protein